MECSALAACAEFRRAILGQILFSADTSAFPDSHDDRGWGESSWEGVFRLRNGLLLLSASKIKLSD